MRKTILAAVALSPMLIHAQVNSPAQPQSAGTSAVLESRLAAPKTPGAPAKAAVPVRTPERISSGVTFPKLIATEEIVESADWQWRPTEAERVAVVRFIVDPTGKPSQVHIVQSLGAVGDGDVLTAVSHYRFQPGTLDRQPVPIEITLTVNILNRVNHLGM
jgi:outer membrane biosynthesis protein TonB